MTYDYELITDLTLVLAQNDEKYIKVNGRASTVVASVHLLTAGATLVFDICNDSFDYFRDTAKTSSDLLLESIKISGSPVNPVSVDELSISMPAPNFIHLKNTTGSAKSVRVSLRGNR